MERDDNDRGRQARVTRSSDHCLRGQESDAIYESRRHGDDGRGRVTDPEHERRLCSRDGASIRSH